MAFGSPPEKYAMGQDHCHLAVIIQMTDHVLDKGKISLACRGKFSVIGETRCMLIVQLLIPKIVYGYSFFGEDHFSSFYFFFICVCFHHMLYNLNLI